METLPEGEAIFGGWVEEVERSNDCDDDDDDDDGPVLFVVVEKDDL